MLVFMLLRAVPANRYFELLLLRIQYKHTVSTVSVKVLPSWWYHMHQREGEAECYLSCLVIPDHDCHNKQKD